MKRKTGKDFLIRIPVETYARIQAAAAADQRTPTSYIRKAIYEKLDQDEGLKQPDPFQS